MAIVAFATIYSDFKSQFFHNYVYRHHYNIYSLAFTISFSPSTDYEKLSVMQALEDVNFSIDDDVAIICKKWPKIIPIVEKLSNELSKIEKIKLEPGEENSSSVIHFFHKFEHLR